MRLRGKPLRDQREPPVPHPHLREQIPVGDRVVEEAVDAEFESVTVADAAAPESLVTGVSRELPAAQIEAIPAEPEGEYVEVELGGAFDEPVEAPAGPRTVGVALEAVLVADQLFAYTPLFDPKDKTSRSAEVLSALAQGHGEGVDLALWVNARPAPGFSAEAAGLIQSVRAGEPVKAGRNGAGSVGSAGTVLKAGVYTAFALTWPARAGLRSIFNRPGPAPLLPQSRGPRSQAPRAATSMAAAQLDLHMKGLLDLIGERVKDGPHFEVSMRLIATATAEPGSEQFVRGQLEALCQQAGYSIGAAIGARPGIEIQWRRCHLVDAAKGLFASRNEGKPENGALIFGTKELAKLSHLVDDVSRPHGLQVKKQPRPLAPVHSPALVGDPYHAPKGLIPFGEIEAGSDAARIVALDNKVLDRHALLLGTTGSGKSVFASHLALNIARADYPLILIDPHGNAADDILNAICLHAPERLDDVVLIDVGDDEFPPALNPLDVRPEGSPDDEIEAAIAQVLEMLVPLGFDYTRTPAAAPLASLALKAMCNANLVLSDEKKLTPLHLSYFFTEPRLRHLVVELSEDHDVRQRFDSDFGTFEKLSDAKQAESYAAINRAVNSLGKSAKFQRMFSGTNKLDFPVLMAGNKIVLLKMARFSGAKELGEAVGAMALRSLRSTMNQWARVRDPLTGELKGTGARVIIDESPTVLKGDHGLDSDLAETRKWDVGFIPIAQYLTQLDAKTREAFLGLCNSVIAFRTDPNTVGGVDRTLSGGTPGLVSETDIVGLPQYHAYGTVLVDDNQPSGAFLFKGLPPVSAKGYEDELRERRGQVVEQSRELIAVSREAADHRLKGPLVEGVIDELQRHFRERGGAPEQMPAALFDDAGDDAGLDPHALWG